MPDTTTYPGPDTYPGLLYPLTTVQLERYEWLPLADVLEHLGIADAGNAAGNVDRARQAAAAYVEQRRPDLRVTVEGATTYNPPPDVVLGALLLTARLYARRSTPQGLASFGEFGPGAILRLDPDVERLLGLGRHALPVVG